MGVVSERVERFAAPQRPWSGEISARRQPSICVPYRPRGAPFPCKFRTPKPFLRELCIFLRTSGADAGVLRTRGFRKVDGHSPSRGLPSGAALDREGAARARTANKLQK